MMMMYNVAESCSTRKPEELGITIGKNGIACDVNDDAKTVPPFPRVVMEEIGEDGITKTVDTWVGSFNGGKHFIEADMINGLFNAVDYIQELDKEAREAMAVESNGEPPKPKLAMKHPLTSYDFHLTKNPYGSDNDISNNPNAFAGKVAMRMFDILSINNFRKQYNTKFDKKNTDFVKKLGTIEADNFYYNVKITNNNMLGLLGAQADSGTIDPKAIIDCVKNGKGIGDSKDIPWQNSDTDDMLFGPDFWLSKYSTSYSTTQKSYIYPMQDISFNALDNTVKIFNKGANSIDTNNSDIAVNWIEPKSNAIKLLSSSNESFFGSVYISDYYKTVSDGLDAANSSTDDIYKDVYELLHDDSVFSADRFKEMIYTNGVFCPKQGVTTPKGKCCTFKIGAMESLFIHKNNNSNESQCSEGTKIYYSFESDKLSDYTSEIENGNITSWFLTECRGFDELTGSVFGISKNKSMFCNWDENYKKIVPLKWGYGSDADKWVGFFLMGLEAIDYTAVAKHLDSNETFTYLPKLAVLQIGAALATVGDIKEKITSDSLLKKIFIPTSFDKIYPYLNKINYTTRLAYIKYFKDWVANYCAEIKKNLVGNEDQIACKYEIGNKY